MKVHRYNIEVMWLVLAVLSGWATALTEWKLAPQPARPDHVKQQTHSPIQIRPPPSLDCDLAKFLTSGHTTTMNQWAISIELTAFFHMVGTSEAIHSDRRNNRNTATAPRQSSMPLPDPWSKNLDPPGHSAFAGFVCGDQGIGGRLRRSNRP